jgi:hypothetical protein
MLPSIGMYALKPVLTGALTFTPPTQPNASAMDWVLIIDDIAQKYPYPRP